MKFKNVNLPGVEVEVCSDLTGSSRSYRRHRQRYRQIQGEGEIVQFVGKIQIS